MSEYSDQFVLSQRDYYRRNLLGGSWHDSNLISGLYQRYETECSQRGL